MRDYFALRASRFRRFLINGVVAGLVLGSLMISAAGPAVARVNPCATGPGGAGSGFEVAFQANTSGLWTVGSAGNVSWELGLMPGTSPAIAGLSDGGYAVAFQANTGSLWTVGPGGCVDWRLGMMAGTSPGIAGLSGGGFEVAFQANTGSLWTVGSAGNVSWQLGMMRGTSPGIAGLSGGGFEVAFQANTGSLWTVGSAGNVSWQLGMMAGTSPGIAGLSGGGFEVAFQANTGSLWTVGSAGNVSWQLGMMAGTSPGIAGLSGGGFEVAFQANTGSLWTVGSAGNVSWQLGMMAGTSPGIAGLSGGGFEVAFQANTGSLWTVGTAGNISWQLGMMKGTSPTVTALATGSGFTSSISGIDAALAARMSSSWRPGCPVALSGLRYLTVSYRGFDGADHIGEVVVAASAAEAIVGVFHQLYNNRYPIASLRLVDDFGGNDDRSMAANNSSAFNCRAVTGGGGFSEHSYGTAIDLNPVQNPYVSGATVLPPQGRAYLARTPGPGVITAGDAVVSAFARIGWSWGGYWAGPIDYQHFSASGR